MKKTILFRALLLAIVACLVFSMSSVAMATYCEESQLEFVSDEQEENIIQASSALWTTLAPGGNGYYMVHWNLNVAYPLYPGATGFYLVVMHTGGTSRIWCQTVQGSAGPYTGIISMSLEPSYGT